MEIVNESEVVARLSALGLDEPRVVVTGNFATPWHLLDLAVSALERARLFVLNPQTGWPQREGLVTESPFIGPGIRGSGDLDYLPMRLSLVPRLFGTIRQPDVVLLHATPPRDGKLSLGIEVNILPAAIEAVRRRGGLVVAQLNPNMPYTFGDAEFDVAEIDLAFEHEAPLASPPPRSADDDAQLIGEHVSSLVHDGSTLQVGIGQLPDAALAHLKNRHELTVWSEMVSDGIMELELAGATATGHRMVCTFLFGSPEFYQWVDHNPRLLMRRTEVANDPSRIAAQPRMLSINTALEVDLYAQANASYVRGAIYSGFGGQPDFVAGALHSVEGQAILALRSWHDKSDASNVVPLLRNPSCSFQHSAVISEQGIASLFGRSQRAQARHLIEHVAHPRVRSELAEAFASLQ